MSARPLAFRAHTTLALTTVLHAFTHLYGTLLVPLYLLMQSDLGLARTGQATLVLTVYGLTYCLGSFPAGVIADRFNRKTLLGIGLMGNAAAVLLMGVVREYELVLLLSFVGGLFGTLFHPAANALVPAHYPRSPGMAIGLLGIGSGIGMFVGPRFAGWRAESATWQLWDVAHWQRPLVEMGLLGLACGALYLLVASEARTADPQPRSAPGSEKDDAREWRSLRPRVLAIAAILGLRDFAGVATLTLASVFLQKAHGRSVADTGLILGAMMLVGIVANPLAVWLSPGRGRLPALAGVLVTGGAILTAIPHVAAGWVLPVLAAFQACNLGSFALADSAMLERVNPAVRGRVVGLFLTSAGTFASSAPWLMGAWIDAIGDDSTRAQGYHLPFALCGGLVALSALSVKLIDALGKAHERVGPISEIEPSTMAPLE